MKVEIDYKHRGEQVRLYGPRQYDVTITITSPPSLHDPEYHYRIFEDWARRATTDWVERGQGHFASWWLRETERLDKNKWRFVVQQDYLD